MIKQKSGIKTNSIGTYWWYNLGTVDELINTEYPEYTLPKTYNKLDVKIIRVNTDEYRDMDEKAEIVVVVDDVFLPVGQDGYYPFMKSMGSKRYAVTLAERDGKQCVILGIGG